MPRTNSTDVVEILGGAYDSVNNPSVEPFITIASILVDQVVTCAARKRVTIPAATLREIERWLAADAYTVSDPLYLAKSTDGASATFARGGGEYSDFARMAMRLDPSGCLEAIMNHNVAGASWAGKAPSGRTPYDQRN